MKPELKPGVQPVKVLVNGKVHDAIRWLEDAICNLEAGDRVDAQDSIHMAQTAIKESFNLQFGALTNPAKGRKVKVRSKEAGHG